MFSVYSDWNAGLVTLVMEHLQSNDGSEFWGLADAFYSALWASEYESRKTAFGGSFFMNERNQSSSEFKSFSGM